MSGAVSIAEFEDGRFARDVINRCSTIDIEQA